MDESEYSIEKSIKLRPKMWKVQKFFHAIYLQLPGNFRPLRVQTFKNDPTSYVILFWREKCSVLLHKHLGMSQMSLTIEKFK